jgi:hypothetical protein
MMGTEAFHSVIRANTGRDLDAVQPNGLVEFGEFTDIINTAVFYKVNIIIYRAQEDSAKGEWLYFGPKSENEV